MYYYLIMALALWRPGAVPLPAAQPARLLLAGDSGDDEDAAEALGVNVLRYKMYAVAISSGMAGGRRRLLRVLPEQPVPGDRVQHRALDRGHARFHRGRLWGTLFGPIFGTFILTPLGELVTEGIDLLKHWRVIDPETKLDGLKLLVWSFIVVLIVLFKPTGLWPWVCDRLRLMRREEDG